MKDISEEFKATEEYEQIIKREKQFITQRELFKGLTFFLNRETPIYSLEYIIFSFGGKICLDETSSSITHHVMDRPLTADKKQKTREYVVPQWVYDSINNVFLLPTSQYLPGKIPPPHLSPFIDNKMEGYMPSR
jgi:pescadillo